MSHDGKPSDATSVINTLLAGEREHMNNKNGEDLAQGPLTIEEIRNLRRIIRADDRARWLWASARTWAIWITTIVVALTAIKGYLIDILSGKH
jgi:hypothetical protein